MNRAFRERSVRSFALVALLGVGWFLVPGLSKAGDGEYLEDQTVTCLDGQDRTLDLMNISLFLDQDPAGNPATVESWSNRFVSASERIWDFTEKQSALNEVVVYRRTKPGGIDVVAAPGESARASVYSPGGFLGIGASGLGGGGNVFLDSSGESGATIAHEFGHYAFGVSDDYKVYIHRDSDGKFLYRNPTEWVNKSLLSQTHYNRGWSMNRLSTAFPGAVSPTGDASGRANPWRDAPDTIMCDQSSSREMSTPGNHYTPWVGTVTHGGSTHNVTYTIAQHDEHQESAWDTINELRGLIIPSLPVNNSADYATEMPPLKWTLAELHPSVMVCLDRSGSMGPNYHQQGMHLMPIAIAGAGKAIDNSSIRQQPIPIVGILEHFPGDNVGVVSYASSAGVNAALREMETGANKTSHKNSIANLTADGVTEIGAGLRESLRSITDLNGATRPAGESEMIFLLSDGEHNSGEDPEGAVLDALKARKVKIHTIALGPAVDAGLMSRLAAATGGKTRRISSASGLDQFFAEIYTDARDASMVDTMVGSVDTAAIDREVILDPYGNMDVTFNLFWESGDLDLNLIKPDGTVIDHAAATVDPNMELIESDRTELIRVIAPAPGVWRVRVVPVGQQSSQNYSIQIATVGRDNVRLHVSAPGSSLTHPAPLLISAHFSGPFSGVKGVEVAGTVLRPDGSSVPFVLFDDGNPAHGDEHADDGIYANRFTNFSIDGEYRFVITGNNVDGMTCMSGFYAGIPDGFGIPPSEPVAPFSRQQTITVHYDGIPEFINATLYTETDFAAWELDRSSGAMVGSLIVSNKPDSVKTLIEPFWYAVTETYNIRLAQVDGYTEEGDPYVNVTAKVNAALQAKYGRQSMAPGEWVVIEGIRVYSRDRSIPDMTAVWSLWADPPGMAGRRVDNYDINADGVLGDSEILLALQNWYANDMPDFDLLRRIELWKKGPNPFRAD